MAGIFVLCCRWTSGIIATMSPQGYVGANVKLRAYLEIDKFGKEKRREWLT